MNYGQRFKVEKAVTFSIDFPNIYNDYLFASVIDSFILLFW